MELVLNRRAGVPVRDQLVAQLEMQILGGTLTAGKRLPSVRALARRLNVHANTVSAAYRALQNAGHVERRQGSGVYVRAPRPRLTEEASGLDEMIRLALETAFRRGFTGAEVRAAVLRWLSAAPTDRVLVVDAEREMAELLVQELQPHVARPVRGITFEDLAREPEQAAASLIAAHRYHVARLGRLLPGAPIEPLNIHAPEVRTLVRNLPAGSLIVVVSHSPALLPIASVLLQTMREGEIVVETRLLSARSDWKALVKAAEFVLADVLSFPAVRPTCPKRVQEFRLVADESIARVRAALGAIVAPAPVR
jgi:DNA-binding transcriptional regulator YhcF (GntR family)